MKKLVLFRDVLNAEFTLGEMTIDNQRLGFTCEDTDRQLESGGEKIYGQTAIPRGEYLVTLSFSRHFQKVLPEIHDVPGFDGVRIHGGNTAADTLGCILLGMLRTGDGCANCAPAIERLISLMEEAEAHGDTVWLEVK